MEKWTSRVASFISRRPFVLFVVLYAAIVGLALLADQVLTGPLREAVIGLTGGRGLGGIARGGTLMEVAGPPPKEMWAVATVAMACAGALVLPLAWLYTITRQKRGYQQSMVHSLVLLPVIVAGVAILVKFSLALAFSLAGIVAAVRFRHTLEDSKDAVYIFAATSIGLASGVDLTAAFVLSFVFNLVTLTLFRSDFGRTPARLEGDMAEERMRRALSIANRTSQFVARIDKEILQSMAPEQLEALADRAWRRRQESAPITEEKGGFDTVLTVRTNGSLHAREGVEAVLERQAKRWHFKSAAGFPGEAQVLEYELRLKKSALPAAFLDAVRALGSSGVTDAELK